MNELSQYLKSERLRRGLSLQDVARKAKIGINSLKALEQGRFLDIGPPSLVRSHLVAYSRALGISQLPPTQEQAPHRAPTPSTSPDPPRPQGSCLPAKRTGVLRLVALLVIGLVLLGVCYQIGWISRPDRDHSNNQLSHTGMSPESPVRSETPSSASATADAEGSLEEPSNHAENQAPQGSPRAVLMTEQEAEKEPLTTFSTGSAVSEESASSQPTSLHHRFEIQAFQESWVEVKKDGRKTEGMLLHPGERREWPVVQELQILVGNAGGVQMKWDGAPVKLGGRPGQVLRFRLPHPDLTGKSP